mgnify:CR=1 FL=1
MLAPHPGLVEREEQQQHVGHGEAQQEDLRRVEPVEQQHLRRDERRAPDARHECRQEMIKFCVHSLIRIFFL